MQVGPDTITINRDDRILVSEPDGRIRSEAEQGFFASDTRYASAYDMWLNGQPPGDPTPGRRTPCASL